MLINWVYPRKMNQNQCVSSKTCITQWGISTTGMKRGENYRCGNKSSLESPFFTFCFKGFKHTYWREHKQRLCVTMNKRQKKVNDFLNYKCYPRFAHFELKCCFPQQVIEPRRGGKASKSKSMLSAALLWWTAGYVSTHVGFGSTVEERIWNLGFRTEYTLSHTNQ